MASLECCFQAGRPPAERLKNLCVACLVFDAIFVFIYTGTALMMTTPTPKTACYEEMGYGWHNMLTLSYTVSAMAAVVGAVVHASVSCSPSIMPAHLSNIARYAHGLVLWTFVAAVIEAVADRQEPPECSSKDDSTTAAPTDQTQAQTQMIWQVAYSALWLSWLTGVVAAAYMARRVAPFLAQERDSAAAAAEAGQSAADPSQGGPPPQTVGVPVQMSMGAPDCQGGSVTGAPLAFGSVPGGAAPGLAVSAGAPFSTAPGGVPGGTAVGATWEGTPVFGGGMVVAQGRPVPGSAPDPDKQRAAGPKTVD